jgi:hypothetical protein
LASKETKWWEMIATLQDFDSFPEEKIKKDS